MPSGDHGKASRALIKPSGLRVHLCGDPSAETRSALVSRIKLTLLLPDGKDARLSTHGPTDGYVIGFNDDTANNRLSENARIDQFGWFMLYLWMRQSGLVERDLDGEGRVLKPLIVVAKSKDRWLWKYLQSRRDALHILDINKTPSWFRVRASPFVVEFTDTRTEAPAEDLLKLLSRLRAFATSGSNSIGGTSLDPLPPSRLDIEIAPTRSSSPEELLVLHTRLEAVQAKFEQTLRECNWTRAISDPKHPDNSRANFGSAIGYFQDQQGLGLIAATHKVLKAGTADYPEVATLGQLVFEMLRIGERIRTASGALSVPFSPEHILNANIRPCFTPSQRCYLFLLYFTYYRVELGEEHPSVKESVELMRTFRPLSVLENFLPGLNHEFVKFHGEDMFRGFEGREFANSMYKSIVIKAGDTARRLIAAHYRDYEVSMLAVFRALQDHHSFLNDVGLDDPLDRVAGQSIALLPAKTRRSSYESRMQQFKDDIERERQRRDPDAPETKQ